jgi:hypothetical protein
MCNTCNLRFTIHDCTELKRFLKIYNNDKEIFEEWFQRGYFTNLIYLEYLESRASNDN